MKFTGQNPRPEPVGAFERAVMEIFNDIRFEMAHLPANEALFGSAYGPYLFQSSTYEGNPELTGLAQIINN